MQTALVTGGCGFLGSAIVRELLARGVTVRVLALPSESTDNVDGLGVQIVRGNVLRIDDARAAVRGADTVFHAAAVYKDWVVDPTSLYEVNLRGTFNVLEAARSEGVRRVVYTASIVSLGRAGAVALGDEDTPYDSWELDFPYARSKYFSRLLAEDFARWGLDVRIVCPAVLLGPGDIAPTPSGKIVINALRYRSGTYTSGGIAYVDARDAALVHVLAAERGSPGRRYVAAAHNLTHDQLLRAIFDAAGISPRLFKVPYPAARALARAVDRVSARKGVEPPMASVMLEYASKPAFFSNRRAVEELGATFRPLRETLDDAIAYFRARGTIA